MQNSNMPLFNPHSLIGIVIARASLVVATHVEQPLRDVRIDSLAQSGRVDALNHLQLLTCAPTGHRRWYECGI